MRSVSIGAHKKGTSVKSKSLKAALLGSAVAVASLAFAPAAFAATTPLLVGQTGSIALPQAPDASTDEVPSYTSSDKKIVSVSKTGAFKAKKAGTATLTATSQDGDETETSFTVYAQDNVKANKPKAVTRLTATQSGENSAQLKWNKSSNANGYVVYQKISGSYAPVRVTSGSATSCTIDGLDPNKGATFAVCSYKKVTVKVGKGKKAVKEKRLALAAKSPYASLLIATDDSTSANASGVAFKRNKLTIVGRGTAETMAYATSSSAALPVFDSKLRYISSDEDVATVDANGTVQSKSKTEDNCTITVIAHNGKRATIEVEIIPALTNSSATFVAHRGDSSAAPENTTAATVMAAVNGYKSMEFDVWETNSGDLVVLHDKTLKRMYGVDKDIRDLNTTDINSANYYGNFKIAAGSNLAQYRELTVPSFEEIVRLAAGFNLNLTVHIKNTGDDHLTQAGLNKLASILKLYNMQDKATLATPDMDTLEMLGSLSGFKTQFLVQAADDFAITGADYMNELKKAADYAASMGCSCISIKYRTGSPFDAELIDYCHKQGLKVSTWDVSSKKRACTLIDMGVDSLTLDKKLFS